MNNTAKMFGYQIINDGKVIFKRVSKSKHFLTTPPGIAIDEDIFNEAVEEGIKYLQIFEREEKLYYSTSVKEFKKKSISFNRRYGQQLALPLNYWITSKSKEIPKELTIEKQPLPLLFPIKNKPKVENKQQLSLF